MTSPFRLLCVPASLMAAGLLCGIALQQPAAAQQQQPAAAQQPLLVPPATSALGWQACQTLATQPAAQLACFQQWAGAQPKSGADAAPAGSASAAETGKGPSLVSAPQVASVAANPQTGAPASQVLLLPGVATESADGKPIGCRNSKYSELSRFWELQTGSSCGTFGLRGFRPTSVSLVLADGVNARPMSANPDNTAALGQRYQKGETKINVSVRTKLAQGLLKGRQGNAADDDTDRDSLWFGYSQQSHWQIFNTTLSRPFRTTDHEPELIYIYPHQLALPGGWSYRLSGLGLVHQSNGQSLPLSRSWNRVYVTGAAEKILGPDSSLSLQAKVWQRLENNRASDDNPGIEDDIGRGELSAQWKINRAHTLGLTVRHALQKPAHGSTRLEWLIAPSPSPSYTGLRYHVQLFSGYGDSLIDYNRKRTALSVGFSLVDW